MAKKKTNETVNSGIVSKRFTETTVAHPHGTIHSYTYFQDSKGNWIYLVAFHTNFGFGPTQIRERKKLTIETAIEKARKVFEETFGPIADAVKAQKVKEC